LKIDGTLIVRRKKIMDGNILILIVIGLAGLLIAILGMSNVFKRKGLVKNTFIIIGVMLLAWVLLSGLNKGGVFGEEGLSGTFGQFLLSTAVVQGGDNDLNDKDEVTTYQPTASYSTRDIFSATTSISGTSYYKRGTNSASTTQASNVNEGEQITYWVSNSSYYVKPVTKKATDGVTSFEALGFANGTATVTLYDTVNRQTVTNAAYNTSMGANDVATIEITYQGTAKQSTGPFGGIMVAEQNSTMSSVVCNGEDLVSDAGYHLTYTTSVTTHAYKTWTYGPSLDDGSANPRKITCQYKNSASAVGAGSAFYIKLIPANYYITDAGDIVLDTEKFANGESTRTGLQTVTATAYWGV
jgi:hypothetical protein